MAASASAQRDVQGKFEQIVQDFFLKGVQIILQSRVPSNGKSAAKSPSQSSSREGTRDRRFNLAFGDFPAVVDGLEVCKAKGFRSAFVDVLLVRLKHRQTEAATASLGSKQGEVDGTWRTACSHQENCNSILERWALQYACRDEGRGVGKEALGAEEVPVVYKSIMILLRSLCCMTRLLPAYRLSQLANCSSYGNYFGISFRVSSLPHPLSYMESTQMSSYKFAPIQVPAGKLCLSVKFRAVMASDLKGPSEVRLPSIVKDYIGSSTSNPIKLHDHGRTSLMLNFGGCLPLTVNIPSSLPHDICRGERLNCSTCDAPNFAHSCSHGPLQKSLSCRISSGCVDFSPEEHFFPNAQFSRQRKSIVHSVSRIKVGATVSRACNTDCTETGVDDFAPPFAVDDSKFGKRCNSYMNEVLGSYPSSQNPLKVCEGTVKEAAFQISREAAIGALVQLLQFAPPLQQAVTPIESHDSSKSPKSSARENSDGNFCIYLNKSETFGILQKDAHFQMLYSAQKEGTSSYTKKTAAQALKELDCYKDIKQWLLDRGKK